MSEITITITADEDDLRGFAFDLKPHTCGPEASLVLLGQHAGHRERRLKMAIAAALPKPHIIVKPGMVLRRKSDGVRWFAREGNRKDTPLVIHPAAAKYGPLFDSELNPDEWEVILDV